MLFRRHDERFIAAAARATGDAIATGQHDVGLLRTLKDTGAAGGGDIVVWPTTKAASITMWAESMVEELLGDGLISPDAAGSIAISLVYGFVLGHTVRNTVPYVPQVN